MASFCGLGGLLRGGCYGALIELGNGLSGSCDTAVSEFSEFWIIRHGEPEGAGAYLGRGSNPPLSAEGGRQALRLAARIHREAPGVIYTSPLKRAVETITPVSAALGLEPVIAEDLAELDFGEWEGLRYEQIHRRDARRYERWLANPWRTAPPGGETYADLSRRVLGCIRGLLKRYGGQRVLASTHAGPIRAVLMEAYGLTVLESLAVQVGYADLFRLDLNIV
ncbi:MAG: hypothetical protein B0D92_02565 [Spirochaeta sp. LUC14_002_19_P3]|nr:MAG: hypothetical protein B0D92_02565 [Spirochaeta sp. LUC14_002_19_P3]